MIVHLPGHGVEYPLGAPRVVEALVGDVLTFRISGGAVEFVTHQTAPGGPVIVEPSAGVYSVELSTGGLQTFRVDPGGYTLRVHVFSPAWLSAMQLPYYVQTLADFDAKARLVLRSLAQSGAAPVDGSFASEINLAHHGAVTGSSPHNVTRSQLQ